MGKKELESVLNASVNVDEYEVKLDQKRDVYVIHLNFNSLNSSDDISELLKLKNKLRSVLNRSYKIELHFKTVF